MSDTQRISVREQRHITLGETLDRVLNKGAVVAGELTLSVADVDLIYVGLQLVVSSVESLGIPDDEPGDQ